MREIYLVIKTQKVYFFMVQQKHPLDGQTQNSFAISFDLKWEKKMVEIKKKMFPF